ncbi:tripartite tricarboxylate transporter substrate binding protein [Roseomonas sp. NAR14]|uniref:Tripartite tricarboxylate transporter substrate binding protein n=1 Tax=Roseomonas acroporae TaxID=2937791 RepID=A0A9X2BT90_9PROT|nr:tripartite tricarboxylate transporter substrate binding protein [Roseomonas acroporae]MCK8784002.1 tripartite tricarboxylate transporter substrate binding protein [Roseomonas acroporae]
MRRRGFIAGLLAAPLVARAETWPAKPVRLVVAWPPGGTTDILARQMQPQLSAALGQPVVIDNRGGASGVIGATEIARAAPNGYTFGMVTSTLISMALLQRTAYHPIDSFSPILLHSRAANMLVVHPSLPAHSVAEFVALAKSRPGGLSFGSAGIGSAMHIAGEMFKLATGTSLVHVPYRGGGPAVADLVAGSLPAAFANASSALPFIRQGAIRALAVTSPARVPYLPEVPTLAESGLPGFASEEWFACIGPAQMPAEIAARLNGAMMEILSDAAERARLIEIGAEVAGGTPAEFGRFLADEVEKTGRVVREARLTLE